MRPQASTLIFPLVLGWAVTVNAGSPLTKPLTVCEVLKEDPTKFNGKVIAVRGEIEATDEGSWLRGDCKQHLVTNGVRWPNALWVEVDQSDDSVARFFSKMANDFRRRRIDVSRDRVWITYIGRVETRETINDEVAPGPDGLMRAGFGHMGAAPAQIVVSKAKDIVVERRGSTPSARGRGRRV